MTKKFSGYISIFNDWEILPHTLRSVAPYIDELVVVDGAYQWMAPFLHGVGKRLMTSAQPVYDCLEAAGIPYRVVSGVWENEFKKRQAGYLACRYRYIFRIDADDIFFLNHQNLEDFLSAGAAVGEMEYPLHLAPDWVLTHKMEELERTSFLFDSTKIRAEDHLYYLWLIDKLPPTTKDRPPVFSEPVSCTAHLTSWRTPLTSLNRAAFYVLNYYRHHGVDCYNDLRSKPLDDFAAFFRLVAPDVFLDVLKNHQIVVGDEELKNRILKRSPLAEAGGIAFAPLYSNFLHSQARGNAEFAASGRYALGAVDLDVTSEATVTALGGRELVLTCSLPLQTGKASVRYLLPEEPWEIVRELVSEVDTNMMKIDLPFGNGGEPAYVRRFLRFEGWAVSGNPLLRFTVRPNSAPAACS